MSPSIVIVGSVNMDLMLRCPHLPLPGETVLGSDFRTLPGGKGANQAVAAARLGASVSLIDCVGGDSFGDQAMAALRAEGIDLRHLHVARGAVTGVAMVLVDDSGENSITLASGANAALSIERIDAASAAIAGAALLVCQLETPLASVQRAIAIAHAAGVPVLLNPAPAQSLPDVLLRQVTWLTPNEGEAAVLSGCGITQPADAQDAAQALVRRGAQSVIVTLGAQGVAWADATGTRHQIARPARVQDTTGAGDAFVGALAAELVQGRRLGEAIAFAQCAAAYSVERIGAQASMPRRKDFNFVAAPTSSLA